MSTTEADVINVSFDMEQNQPLPKLSVSEVFYARQIWVYNLIFVLMQDTQNATNTFVFLTIHGQKIKVLETQMRLFPPYMIFKGI